MNLVDFLSQIENKLSRDDLSLYLQAEGQKIKSLQSQFHDFEKSLENNEENVKKLVSERLKKKMNKLMERLNISLIEKTLKTKASEEEVRKEFDAMEERLTKLLEEKSKNDSSSAKIKQEIARINGELNKVMELIINKGEGGVDGPTLSNFCITCGHREARFLTSTNMIRGNDGRLYYGDPQQPNTPSYALGTTIYDRIEVANSEHRRPGTATQNDGNFQKISRPSTASSGKQMRSKKQKQIPIKERIHCKCLDCSDYSEWIG